MMAMYRIRPAIHTVDAGARLTEVSLFCALVLALTSVCGCGGGGGTGAGGGSTATLYLTATPSAATINPGVSFSVIVVATGSGTNATPSILLGTLPAGITTSATFPMNVPTSGARVRFTASSSLVSGTYSIKFSGTAGSATASASLALTVQAGTPSAVSFATPEFDEFQVAQASSTTLQLQSLGSSIYDVTLGVTGLPAGVTATFNPPVIEPGQKFSVTLLASATAVPAHNIEWTLTGTPAANVTAPSIPLLLNVTSTTGAGWSNQSSYVSTRATPISAVYDPFHQLIYAANPVWNEIHVISDKTRAQLTKLAIRDPRAMDMSIDGTRVWVATGSQVMYSIDTATQKMTSYQLPNFVTSTNASGTWEGWQVFSLSDGTVLVDNPFFWAIWDPSANSMMALSPPNLMGAVARSGDGKRIFSAGGDENETSFTYDVLSHTFSPTISLSSFGYAGQSAANADGSRVVVQDHSGMTLYDSNFNMVGSLPGEGALYSSPIQNQLWGGFVLGPDGTKIYEELATPSPVIATVDVATRQVTQISPAMPIVPIGVELSPIPFCVPVPFAVDSAGMVLSFQYHGIAFDDATVPMNYSPMTPGSPYFLQHANVYSGPLSGGTAVSGFGDAFGLVPDVYFGTNRGTASLGSSGNLTITSPPASAAGPVDVKILFPDGNEVFNPQFFTYGTQIQTPVISAGPPQGGVAATLTAFGLPIDPSQDTVTVGGQTAAVTSKSTQYPPFTDEQSAMFLSYTVPAGSPGWADLAVTTPNGTSSLPHGFYFEKNVTDYALTDSPTFVLYDKGRNQLYLSAGDHIDVFSLASNSFRTPLNPPSVGGNKQFQGLALTLDEKTLLAADLVDNSLAVLDPDAPSTAFAISLPAVGFNPGNSCPIGPLFVAADNAGAAYVVDGSVVGIACGPGGVTSIVNLAAKTSAPMNIPHCGASSGAAYVTSIGDGSRIGFGAYYGPGGFAIYVPAQAACLPAAGPTLPYGMTSSSDGNVLGVMRAFADPNGNVLGRFAYPTVLYPSASSADYDTYAPYQDGALQNPALNAAGSLYYWPYPGYVDIIDVQHGISTLRLGLSETVASAVSPMAIDSSGQHVFLITNKGLTIVDLGNAPLSIGHLSETAVTAGQQIVIRGSGFQPGITASVGGVAASVVFTDTETLSLTTPSTLTGIQDVVLTNPDGAVYTLQSAVDLK